MFIRDLFATQRSPMGLKVGSRRHIMEVVPRADGTTSVEIIENQEFRGTFIEVQLGPDAGPIDFQWANLAITLSQGEQRKYKGKTSPWWYNFIDFLDYVFPLKARIFETWSENSRDVAGRSER